MSAEPDPAAGSFPDPVSPCPGIQQMRRQRLVDLTRITWVGIGVRLIVIAAELAGFAVVGSSVLLVDAIASLFDVAASLVLLAAVHFAARPPDEEHPFGHGRAEPLAGFQLGLLLCGTGFWLAFQNLVGLVRPLEGPPIPAWLWLIPAVATLLLSGVCWTIQRVGRSTESPALLAEAAHFRIDAVTSLVAAASLLAASLLADLSAAFDRGGGAVLALIMIVLGARAAWLNLHQLLDRIPHEEDFARVRESAARVEGVLDVEKVRIQRAGPDAHVDIDIEVAPEISVAESHAIAQHVRARIQTDWPFVREVVVHVEPYYAGDH